MTDDMGPGRTLFQFVRFWARRWAGTGAGIDAERGRDVMVTQAALARADAGGATINDIAAELGIDQSGASRMVAHAVAQGFLAKDVAVDARQRIVSVTEAGRTLVSQAHTWQETTFARLTADWSPADIARFTALMTRLVASREDEL